MTTAASEIRLESASTVESEPASGDYARDIPARLSPEELKRLSRLSPWRSTAHIALEWGLIVAAAALCWRFWHPALYVVAVAFIAARQHAIMLLAHDAAHYRLFRSRTANDWVGEVFLAWPLVVLSMRAYRNHHLPHHRHLNSDRDPDWVRKRTPEWAFPMKPSRLARMLLTDASGIGFVKFIVLTSKMPKSPATGTPPPGERAFKIGRLVFLATMIGTLTYLHAWTFYLLFFLIPFVTWLQVISRLRSIAEHFGIPSRPGLYRQTRTVLTSWLERLFILSKNGNYHLEHHLYPSVPFYRLPELHRVLMQEPAFRDAAHVTRGYRSVLRECTDGS